MKVLLLSAVLYLTGVVVVLFLKPALMFQEDGRWKEFGLSDPSKYTWFPFWLFCILWSLVSYAIVRSSVAAIAKKATPTMTAVPSQLFPSSLFNEGPSREMKAGYYLLNREAMGRDGIPKYIYIGEAPELASS